MTDRFSWKQAAVDAPNEEALRFGNTVWNFRQFAARIALVSEELRAYGAGPGKAVALRANNGLRGVLLAAAAFELEAPLVLLHPRLTQAEEQALLMDAQPFLLAREGEIVALQYVKAMPSHIAAVMFTSGTSGRPRGAMLSRQALRAAVQASAESLPVGPGDRWLLCLPLCHIGGFSILLRCLAGRASIVLAPGFHAKEILALIEKHRPTVLSLVPTMLHKLLEIDSSNLLATLRTVLLGGAAASATLLEQCAQRGIAVRMTYGLTETCSQVTTQVARDPFTVERGVGVPLPGVRLRIVDEKGDAVAPGVEGRVCIQSPMMMDGYLHEPSLQGEFDTGDLGSLDEHGCLHIHARRTDLIVTGGENVYPAEVEASLQKIEGVKDAMVFGIPDPVWGQVVTVALIPTDTFSIECFREAVHSQLASYKRPRRFCLVEEFPTNSIGKPLRYRVLEATSMNLAPL